MNLTWAKYKKQRQEAHRDPFARRPLSKAFLQPEQEGLAHAIRLEGLRKGNFHTVRNYERQLSVIENRNRYQILQTHQTEYDRLRADHGLLGARAAQRMEDLKNLLGINDA